MKTSEVRAIKFVPLTYFHIDVSRVTVMQDLLKSCRPTNLSRLVRWQWTKLVCSWTLSYKIYTLCTAAYHLSDFKKFLPDQLLYLYITHAFYKWSTICLRSNGLRCIFLLWRQGCLEELTSSHEASAKAHNWRILITRKRWNEGLGKEISPRIFHLIVQDGKTEIKEQWRHV